MVPFSNRAIESIGGLPPGPARSQSMDNKPDWNENARLVHFERLRSVILGSLRLARNQHHKILEYCREVYIEGECPEDEFDSSVQFAADELTRAAAQLELEKAAWPEETDCDRLDRVEIALCDKGILFWQVSPCCDTCTRSEIPDRISVIDKRAPGFRQRVRGYAFFIEQNMPEMLAESTHTAVAIGYGWFSPNDNVCPVVYRANALSIAEEVCNCLRHQRFEPEWNGDLGRKIVVSLNWQRRTMLE